MNAKPKPRYQQLKDLIITRISSGELAPNDRVPSENELVESHWLYIVGFPHIDTLIGWLWVYVDSSRIRMVVGIVCRRDPRVQTTSENI